MKKILVLIFLLFSLDSIAQVKFFMIDRSTGGGTYTVERTWKIKPVNQFLSATQFATWAALPATGDNTIPAGTSWTSLRDIDHVTTSSIGFTAVTGFTGSSGSLGPTSGGTDVDIFCNNQLTQHGWEYNGTTTTFKLTGLQAGKYYQIGIYANTENWMGNQQSISTTYGSVSAYATGNNYGACGPSGDDLDDGAIKWIYNNQADGSGELSITITKTAGSIAALNGLIVLQTNIAKP